LPIILFRLLGQNATYMTGPINTLQDSEEQSNLPLSQLTPDPASNTNTANLPRSTQDNPLIPNNNYRVFTSPNLTDAITLRPDHYVIVDGQRFILRGLPTNTIPQTIIPEVKQDSTTHLCAPDEESSSKKSVDAFHHCYIPPEPNESNAESVQRDEEIKERIRLTKLKRKHHKQHVQTITLDDLNPHGLYAHHDQPLSPQPITVIYDSGVSITMLPGAFTESWRNLRPSLMKLSGAFATKNQLQSNLWVGEFHAELTLDMSKRSEQYFPKRFHSPLSPPHTCSAIPSTSSQVTPSIQATFASHNYI
jgi:hypothetical protein